MADSPDNPKNGTLNAIQDININFVDTPLQWSLLFITFTDRDFKGINSVNQYDHVVVSIIIANFMVSRVLIDQDSYADILYWKTFQRLKVSPDTVHPHADPLLDFPARESRLEAMCTWWPPSVWASSEGASPSDIYWLTQTHHVFRVLSWCFGFLLS